MEDYVKRYVSKDGTHRITIYYDEYADNPRYTTDEPLHCEDWDRDYSVMCLQERANCVKSSNARSLLGWFLREYGDHKKILDTLVKSGKDMDKTDLCDALVYDRHEKQWILYSHGLHYDYEQRKNVTRWFKYDSFYRRKDELDTFDIIDMLEDDSIEYLANNCMTDKIKAVSYNFGYFGSISFEDKLYLHSNGICWLEKDEFLKYSGHKEEYWKGKSLKEIEGLLDELEAWGDNEVYHYCVEKRATFHVRKECTSEVRDVLECDTEEWEDVDSCSGFYGDISYCFEYAVENTPFKKEDFSEV